MKRHIFIFILALFIASGAFTSWAQNVYVHTNDGQTFTTAVQDIVNFGGDYFKPDVDPEAVPDNEIWYVTSNGKIFDLENSLSVLSYGENPFDVNVISNTYENGCGVIKCDGPITALNRAAFQNSCLIEIYLPDCVKTIGVDALSNTMLREFRVPASLTAPDNGEHYSPRYWYMMTGNKYLKRFYGNHCSKDGRSLIIDGVLCGFAPCGISEYIVPDNVKIITCRVFSANGPDLLLDAINFPEGLEYIDGDAFDGQSRLKSITLPNSLLNINSYAFKGCINIEGFYGNEKFHTPDNKCLLFEKSYSTVPNGKWVGAFAGKGITEYTIPDGIIGIENYAMSGTCSGGRDLQKLTLPGSILYATSTAFEGCNNLEAIYGDITSADHRCIVTKSDEGTVLNSLVARKNMPKEYRIPDDISIIGYCAMVDCDEVESITMGDQVKVIEGYAFLGCDNLKSVTLSAGLEDCTGYNLFSACSNLESVYLRAPVPPRYDIEVAMEGYPNLSIYIPHESITLYRSSRNWTQWSPFFKPYDYGDLSMFYPDFYYSTDYSQDGVVHTFQTATEGAGIDIVLMGDGYSDRQIADGTYQRDMRTLYDNLFTEEPYRSFRDLFNVYSVNVVSMTEGLEHNRTALNAYFGVGTFVGGNDATCFDYAQEALDQARMDQAVIIVSINEDAYAGTCFMYYPTSEASFGAGPSVCYFPRGGDDATFASLLHHEALGHGFAKLADEYAYEYMGAFPDDAVQQYRTMQDKWGWYLNVDFTDDPTAVRWARFIDDERYTREGIGVFEGGATYWNGVWRPTENSIMRYNVGGFNAPSRQAIFNRIHHLAYGNEWRPDYELFVAYDAINNTTAAEQERVRKTAGMRTDRPPLHAPVVVAKTWHQASSTPPTK